MAFSKKTYVSGQTAITADNLNAIQDELIDLKNGGLDNYLDTYLKNRYRYYSVSDNLSTSTQGWKQGSPLTIAEPGIYLVIAYSNLSFPTTSPMIVDSEAISRATALISGYARAPGEDGGGAFSIGVYNCEANAQIRGKALLYVADSTGYHRLAVFAIRLN